MSDSLGERIKDKREELGLTQEDIANSTNISRSNIGKIENDKIVPNCNAVLELAKLFQVSTDWLITGKESLNDKSLNLIDLTKEDRHDLEIFLEFLKLRREKKWSGSGTSKYAKLSNDDPPIAATKEDHIVYLPILGNAAAGIPIEIIELPQGEVPVNEKYSKYNSFIIRAQGDSMIDAGINSGDLVIIRPQPVVENGEMALVNVDGAATIKYFYLYNGQCELRSANPKYEPIYYSCGNVSILGKVIEIIKQN